MTNIIFGFTFGFVASVFVETDRGSIVSYLQGKNAPTLASFSQKNDFDGESQGLPTLIMPFDLSGDFITEDYELMDENVIYT